jgi:branched-chain amino acid transport system substrate-binding protein
MDVLDSEALTRVQSIVLIAIVAVGLVGGGTAYFLWSGKTLATESIKIGVCADLDNSQGKNTWQAAVLAAEQVNAEGGVLGRNFTIISEDDDDETPPNDVATASNALVRLITVHKADYIITNAVGSNLVSPFQDICASHKKILFTVRATLNEFTQKVLDNYPQYKYYFRVGSMNSTAMSGAFVDQLITFANYTGFTKIAYLMQDAPTSRQLASGLDKSLPEHGLEIVYRGWVPSATTDFTSSLAAIEASGAQILFPAFVSPVGIAFIKDWYDRQSPTVVFGLLTSAQEMNFWNLTEGKCQSVSFTGRSVVAGYPLTNKTLLTREAYLKRWGETPTSPAVSTYDAVRFILPDAIRRAGTTETESVIETLEETNIETSDVRHFVFTSSHDTMLEASASGGYSEDHLLICVFQWQEGTQVIVYPEHLMEEAGTTYKYPSWKGPWTE